MTSKSAASLPFDSVNRYLPVTRCTPFSDTTYKQYVLGSGGNAKCTFSLSNTAARLTTFLLTYIRIAFKEIWIAAPPRSRYKIFLV